MLPIDADAALGVSRITLAGRVVALEAAGLSEAAACPGCGTVSDSVHDRYRRRPLDLPWRGRIVRLILTVRRFRCLASGCAPAPSPKISGNVCRAGRNALLRPMGSSSISR
jgi:transposase